MVNYLWAAILVLANSAWLALDLVGLPGNWLIIVGTLLVAWLRPGMFGLWTLVAAVALAAVGEVLELFSGVWGAQKGGAGRRGSAGALLGGIIGAIMGTFLIPVPVFGSLLGACAGACLGAWVLELSGGRDSRASLHAGIGAGLGRAVGTIVKLFVGIVLWLMIAIAAFVP
jgi:uncharacterized protein YqgC (DUF456 family)